MSNKALTPSMMRYFAELYEAEFVSFESGELTVEFSNMTDVVEFARTKTIRDNFHVVIETPHGTMYLGDSVRVIISPPSFSSGWTDTNGYIPVRATRVDSEEWFND